jgi:hypothetical protein
MSSIVLPVPKCIQAKNRLNERIWTFNINDLNWTKHVPEAHEIVTIAKRRGFFDIFDRVELEKLRKTTELKWNARIQKNKEEALRKLAAKRREEGKLRLPFEPTPPDC